MVEIQEMMLAHSRAGLTVVDYVRRAASELRMAGDSVSDVDDWVTHMTRAAGFGGMIVECPSRRLTHLSEELDELGETDPEALRGVFAAVDLAQAMRNHNKDLYLSALNAANARI